ncbi:T-cell surface glycoprotein CD1b4-like [Hyperolius riggenbachi]|uniref:T-cell surface glycoprotein CD1b4-like n=1 Tax=Hyperolius riggenbachi TaxID=752182 RepID=UPI0035A28233
MKHKGCHAAQLSASLVPFLEQILEKKMKVFIAPLVFSVHIILRVTSTGSIKIRWLQNYQFSNNLEVFTLWSTLLVEDIETLSVNNDTRIIKFKQSWSKGNLPDADWFIYGMFLTNYMYYFQKHIYDISIEFRFRGDFRIQCWMEIPSSEDDMKGYILKLALEGMDLMYFNVTTESWLAYHTPYSEAIEKFLQNDNVTRASFAASMKNQMHSLAVLYATTGKESFSRKIQPEAYITTRRVFSGTEVLCWATGFYPKPINVSLWKQNKMVDGVLTETLPNGDDTYQITMVASTRWTGEENIYCRVEHSSFKEPLIVQLDKRHSHTLIAVISVMVVAVVVGLTLFMLHHKKRRQYTSIALGRLS